MSVERLDIGVHTRVWGLAHWSKNDDAAQAMCHFGDRQCRLQPVVTDERAVRSALTVERAHHGELPASQFHHERQSPARRGQVERLWICEANPQPQLAGQVLQSLLLV